jgi:hypothetical protein
MASLTPDNPHLCHKKRRINLVAGNISDDSVKMSAGILLLAAKIKRGAAEIFTGNSSTRNIKARDLKSGWRLKAFLDLCGQRQ